MSIEPESTRLTNFIIAGKIIMRWKGEIDSATLYGYEKGAGVYMRINFLEDEAPKVNELNTGDYVSILIGNTPLPDTKDETYRAIKIIEQNSVDLEIVLLDFPEYLPAHHDLCEIYPVTGIAQSGPMQGQEITVQCTKDNFWTWIRGMHTAENWDKQKLLLTEDVEVCLNKGELIKLKDCLEKDDGTYECKGWIDTSTFDSTVEVISATYAGAEHVTKNLGPMQVSLPIPPSLTLRAKFNEGHTKGHWAKIEIFPYDGDHIPQPQEIVSLKGLKRHGDTQFNAGAIEPPPTSRDLNFLPK